MSAVVLLVYGAVGVAVLVAVVLSFFVRRHAESDRPAPGWERTDEVFVDPTSGRTMRVWVEPASRERRYVPEA